MSIHHCPRPSHTPSECLEVCNHEVFGRRRRSHSVPLWFRARQSSGAGARHPSDRAHTGLTCCDIHATGARDEPHLQIRSRISTCLPPSIETERSLHAVEPVEALARSHLPSCHSHPGCRVINDDSKMPTYHRASPREHDALGKVCEAAISHRSTARMPERPRCPVPECRCVHFARRCNLSLASDARPLGYRFFRCHTAKPTPASASVQSFRYTYSTVEGRKASTIRSFFPPPPPPSPSPAPSSSPSPSPSTISSSCILCSILLRLPSLPFITVLVATRPQAWPRTLRPLFSGHWTLP